MLSIGHQLDNTWRARLAPNKCGMHSVHPLEVHLRISVEDLKPGRLPRPPQENPEATSICKRVADPMGTRAIFDYHDDSAAVVEIPDRDPAPLPRATTDGLDDEGIATMVWRTRYSSQKREAGDSVGDADNDPRKSHCLTLRSRRLA